jgi:hypothetical protein
MGRGVEAVRLELCCELGGGRCGREPDPARIGTPHLVGDHLAALDRSSDLTDAGDSPLPRHPTEVDDQVDGVGHEEVGDVGDESFRGHGPIHGESTEDAFGGVGVDRAHRAVVALARSGVMAPYGRHLAEPDLPHRHGVVPTRVRRGDEDFVAVGAGRCSARVRSSWRLSPDGIYIDVMVPYIDVMVPEALAGAGTRGAGLAFTANALPDERRDTSGRSSAPVGVGGSAKR